MKKPIRTKAETAALRAFLRRFRETACLKTWVLLQRRFIRALPSGRLVAFRASCECPISSLLGMPAAEYDEAADMLGLPERVRCDIVTAADDSADERAPAPYLRRIRRLRRTLLEITGAWRKQ